MLAIKNTKLCSAAFRAGVSYIGGKPDVSVLGGTLGKLYFLFMPKHFGNDFFQFIRMNFDSNLYEEFEIIWRGRKYETISLTVPQIVPAKFLVSFREFSRAKNKYFFQ